MAHALLSRAAASGRTFLRARPSLWSNLLLLAFGSVLPYASSGQSGDQWHCRIQLPPMATDVSPKPMFVLLAEHFGASGHSIDEQLGSIVFITERRPTQEDLALLTTMKPYQVLGVQCAARWGETITMGALPFPAYLGTGDATTDDARYDAAKAAWIAADPEGYQHLTTPSSDGK